MTFSGTRTQLAIPIAFLMAVGVSGSVPSRTDLDFKRRVEAQRAIEEVYWRHRLWPAENATSKPPLAAVLSEGAMRAKVEDYLRKSNALEQWWQRPITPEQLQAELDRMSHQTRAPGILRELYAALGNDGFLIAETLARQTLADRLIRNWYAVDDRVHAKTRREAEAALVGVSSAEGLKKFGEHYVEQKFVRGVARDYGGATQAQPRVDGAIELDSERWTAWTESLGRRLGSSRGQPLLDQPSELREEADRFIVSAALSFAEGEAVVASVMWPKRTFDDWWAEARPGSRIDVESDVTAYEITAPLGGGCVDDSWDVRFYLPSARQLHSAVWTGTELIVWGGQSGARLNTGGRYNPSTDSWTATSLGANLPTKRSDHTAVWTGTEMIIWGGQDGFDYTDTGGRYDPSTDLWTATSTGEGVPTPRIRHTAVWTGTEMIVWSGFGDDYLDSGGRYNPSTDSWVATSTGTGLPAARTWHSAVWAGSEMIVWGGLSDTTGHNSGGRYNPSRDSWAATSIGANVPAARFLHTAVWTGAEMIVWGGLNHVSVSTGGRYNPSTDSWSATSTGGSVPTARTNHTAVWTGTAMIVWGGGASGNYVNTGGRYDPTTNSWVATSTGANVPTGRGLQAAVWTGTEMIVWGGLGVHGEANTGGRYNPATNSWTATSTGPNVPAAREGHSAVWTGTEMIVWGAGNGFEFSNTGGRYNPSINSWTATSMGANVPTARYRHTAVWSGTEMIVWGGFSGAGIVNSGGRYNPLTDQWTTTSMGANVPSARSGHSALWTGSELIVWGGSGGNYFNTGGRYNPLTNTWTATSTGEGVPTPRFRHTVVWTGTEMIVWGGYNNGIAENTGGRYNPTTDDWAVTSTGESLPSARWSHTAVWTGTEMILWGGDSFSERIDNTVGRYNPLKDSWESASAEAGVPEARAHHKAVWTGTQMIVWGGIAGSNSSILNTGGRYEPSVDSWTATSSGANVPGPRSDHTTVWTGTQMIVWGGDPLDSNVYLYCAAACAAIPDGDGDGTGDSCDACPNDALNDVDSDGNCGDVDNCPTWTNPGQAIVLFGWSVRAASKTDLVWDGPVDWELATGAFTDSAALGAFTTDFYETGSGTDYSQVPEGLAPGAGRWFLLRPDCSAGSYSTGSPSEVGNRDAILIP